MKVLKRKHIISGLTFIGIFCFVSIAHAQGLTYKPLQPIPGITSASDLPTYLKALFNLGIAAAGLLAVLMIMYGGVKYMSTEAYSGKSDAKDIIIRSLLGLLLAFASWLILFTINPDLLNLDFSMEEIDTLPDTPDDPDIPTDPLTPIQEKAEQFRQSFEDADLGVLLDESVCDDFETWNNDNPRHVPVVIPSDNIGAFGNLCADNNGDVRYFDSAPSGLDCVEPLPNYTYMICSLHL